SAPPPLAARRARPPLATEKPQGRSGGCARSHRRHSTPPAPAPCNGQAVASIPGGGHVDGGARALGTARRASRTRASKLHVTATLSRAFRGSSAGAWPATHLGL